MSVAAKVRHLLFSDYNEWAHDIYEGLNATKNKFTALLGRDKDIRLLDVGCGEMYSATILFTAWGWQVTGIDVDPIWKISPAWSLLQVAKDGGPRAVVKKVAREFAVIKKIHAGLLREANISMPQNLDMRHMSAAAIDFPTDSFDATHSCAVLEHVMDMENALAETARVMKPEAIGIHTYHLYTSLSGGHDVAWAKPDDGPTADVRPWDHLRGGRSPAADILNAWRERDYRECFERHFEILEWNKSREGERYLTPEIRAELSDYSEDELLTRSIQAVVRKKQK